MLDIFICEDDPQQRKQIEKIINDVILIEDLDMEIRVCSALPEDILVYLQNSDKVSGIYFLDVDLQQEMTGIDLASKIREYDNLGKIIFITTHGELSYLTFKYKVEALDYIVKDYDTASRIKECVLLANNRYISESEATLAKYAIKFGDKCRLFNYEDIMFFESSSTPHKVILHLDNSQVEFYGSIKDIDLKNDCLYRCHKSYVVNKNNIESINKLNREIEMVNGEICFASIRGLSGLINYNSK